MTGGPAGPGLRVCTGAEPLSLSRALEWPGLAPGWGEHRGRGPGRAGEVSKEGASPAEALPGRLTPGLLLARLPAARPSPCSQLQSGARFPRRDLGQSWHPVTPRFPGRLCHAMVVTRGTAAGEWAADPIALCPHTGPGQLCAVEVPSQGEPSGGPEAQPASRHSPVPARRGRGGRCQLISQLAGFPPAAALRGGVAKGCLPGAVPRKALSSARGQKAVGRGRGTPGALRPCCARGRAGPTPPHSGPCRPPAHSPAFLPWGPCPRSRTGRGAGRRQRRAGGRPGRCGLAVTTRLRCSRHLVVPCFSRCSGGEAFEEDLFN